MKNLQIRGKGAVRGVGLSKVGMWGLSQARKKDTEARVKDSAPCINLFESNPSSLSHSQLMKSPWDVGINLAFPILPPLRGC